jgi:hypothetical protein
LVAAGPEVWPIRGSGDLANNVSEIFARGLVRLRGERRRARRRAWCRFRRSGFALSSIGTGSMQKASRKSDEMLVFSNEIGELDFGREENVTRPKMVRPAAVSVKVVVALVMQSQRRGCAAPG